MSSSPRKRPASEAIVAGGVVVLLIAIVAIVLLSGAGRSLYPPKAATHEAAATSGLYDIVFAIAVAVFLAVEGLIVWSILRYRRRPEDVDLPPQTHGNNFVEVLWTLIPTVIVLYLFVVSYNTLNTVDTVTTDPDIRIQAIAGQFQWQFEYLDAQGNHIATQTKPNGDGGGMAVPVGERVQVTLTSHDVIHAWYVPRFLFKRDVIPGQTNKFEFTVNEDEAGQTFRGQCAELCGTGHRVMLFNVVAMTPSDFDAWLQNLIAVENATPPPAPSGAPVLKEEAKNISFAQTTLQAPANAPFVIEFTNSDPSSITHDIDIKDSGGKVVAEQDTIPGGTKQDYTYPALPAGTYTFFCSIHSNMTGTLTVQ
ncbi:MAG TPA: cytochrome c oxidase subunit II [Candidatus Limnocylindrales bacterium]|nr:cytochrome c oxidase subunit II [Candidatus Limnocylindrales bacterium]